MSTSTLLPTTRLTPMSEEYCNQDYFDTNRGVIWGLGTYTFATVSVFTRCSDWGIGMACGALVFGCLGHTCSFYSFPDKKVNQIKHTYYWNWFKACQLFNLIGTAYAVSSLILCIKKTGC